MLAVACGVQPRAPGGPAAAADVTLYRNIALIRQRVSLELPAGASVAKIAIAAGTTADQVAIVDRGGLAISAVRTADPPALDDEARDRPVELRAEVTAPRAGRYELAIVYPTVRLHWEVAYTLTTSAARDQATLRGAVAIRNTMGTPLHTARVYLIDSELGSWREHAAERFANKLVGASSATAPQAPLRDLGVLDLAMGETRAELIERPTSRRMRSVLVYDPIGTKLDNPGEVPSEDDELGASTQVRTVTESFEIDRDDTVTAGLPAGPVRLLEIERRNGALTVLGESRLFDPESQAAAIDTIAIGTAQDVTGRRERREWSTDHGNHRDVEEFAIEIDNRRPRAADVLIREHLYRGQNWTLAYPNDTAGVVVPAKEGPQQISLRTRVPARSHRKILYVVVYTWPE